jgi:transposase
MSRSRRIDAKLVSKAQTVVTETTNLGEFRAAQAVLLPAIAHTTLEQTAVLLGVGRATVARLQQRLREAVRAATPIRRGWGGRRRALLTFQEEEEFLAPWVEQAEAAGVLVVSPLRAALAEKLGRKVAASVVYRLLARHGWRKLSPDTKHPKSDPVAQAEWKKNSPRCWQICSPSKRSPGGASA